MGDPVAMDVDGPPTPPVAAPPPAPAARGTKRRAVHVSTLEQTAVAEAIAKARNKSWTQLRIWAQENSLLEAVIPTSTGIARMRGPSRELCNILMTRDDPPSGEAMALKREAIKLEGRRIAGRTNGGMYAIHYLACSSATEATAEELVVAMTKATEFKDRAPVANLVAEFKLGKWVISVTALELAVLKKNLSVVSALCKQFVQLASAKAASRHPGGKIWLAPEDHDETALFIALVQPDETDTSAFCTWELVRNRVYKSPAVIGAICQAAVEKIRASTGSLNLDWHRLGAAIAFLDNASGSTGETSTLDGLFELVKRRLDKEDFRTRASNLRKLYEGAMRTNAENLWPDPSNGESPFDFSLDVIPDGLWWFVESGLRFIAMNPNPGDRAATGAKAEFIVKTLLDTAYDGGRGKDTAPWYDESPGFDVLKAMILSQSVSAYRAVMQFYPGLDVGTVPYPTQPDPATGISTLWDGKHGFGLANSRRRPPAAGVRVEGVRHVEAGYLGRLMDSPVPGHTTRYADIFGWTKTETEPGGEFSGVQADWRDNRMDRRMRERAKKEAAAEALEEKRRRLEELRAQMEELQKEVEAGGP